MNITNFAFVHGEHPFELEITARWDANRMSYVAKVNADGEYKGKVRGGAERGRVHIDQWTEENILGLASDDAMDAVINRRGIDW